MGHGFGELYKLRGIITYKLSPFELKAFHGYFSGGLRRTMRKISDNFFYVVPRKYIFSNYTSAYETTPSFFNIFIYFYE